MSVGATAITALTGTAADIKTALASTGITTVTDNSLAVTASANTSVADINTINADSATGVLTATATETAAATLTGLTTTNTDQITVTMAAASTAAADLNTIDGKTGVSVGATAIKTISGTAAAIATLIAADAANTIALANDMTTLTATDNNNNLSGIDWSNIGTIGTLELSGTGTHQIDQNLLDEFNTINGTGGTNTLIGSAGVDSFDLATTTLTSIEEVNLQAGNDTLTTKASETYTNILDGGTNTDTLNISAGTNLSGATVQNFENITVTGVGSSIAGASLSGSSLNLDMGSNNLNIVGTTGNDAIDLSSLTITNQATLNINSGAGNDNLKGTTGNEIFTFLDANFNASDSVDGVSGNDTIAFTDAMTKDYETDFTGVSNIDTVLGSTSSDSYSLDFANINKLVFDGNTGTDTVALTGSVDVAGDYSFTGGSNLHNIETLDITSLTLTNADTAGGNGNELVLNTQDLKNMTDGNNDITINITDNTQGYGVAIYDSTAGSINVNDLSTTGGDGSGNYTIDSVALHVV